MNELTRRRRAVVGADRFRLMRIAGQKIESSQERIAWGIGHLLATEPSGGVLLRGPARLTRASRVFLDLLAHPCDLDLLLFFHRHPRSLLTPRDLVQRVGYTRGTIRLALERLRAAGLLRWSPSTFDATARQRSSMFELAPGAWGTLLPRFLWLASSSSGRRLLRRAIADAAGVGAPRRG